MLRFPRSTLLIGLALSIPIRLAQAAPTIVQNPGLPAATASFDANLDGNVFAPSFPPGESTFVGPLDIAVPVDGMNTLSAAGSTIDAFTATSVPSASVHADGLVLLQTSNGSASDAAQATTLLEYSVRIIPIAPVPNPPTTVPIVLSGDLAVYASVGNSSFGRAQATFVAPSIGLGFGRVNHSSIFPPRPPAFSATEDVEVGLLYRAGLEAQAIGVAQNTSFGISVSGYGGATASLAFGFDQSRFELDRSSAGLPTFDLESAYRIEVGPPIEAPGGVLAPSVPTGGWLLSIALAGTLVLVATRSARALNRWKSDGSEC